MRLHELARGYPSDVVTVDGVAYAVITNGDEFFDAVALDPEQIEMLPRHRLPRPRGRALSY